MKKIGFLLLTSLSIGVSFAQVSTGTVQTTSTNTGSVSTGLNLSLSLIDNLNIKKTEIFSGIDLKRLELQKKLKDVKNSFSGDNDYKILIGLGDISYTDLENKLLDDYITFKTNVLADYNSINSQLMIIDEKVSLGILTGDSYQTQKSKLALDISGFNSKYLLLADLYLSNGTTKISDFQKSISNLKTQKKDLLTKVKNKQIKIEDLVKAYEKLNGFNQRVNAIYVGNYDDVNTFISQLKEYSTSALKQQLINLLEQNYKKAPKLSYYSGDIGSYNDGLVLSLNQEIDNYFNGILSGFYDQNELNYINTNYKAFISKYTTGSDVKVLSQDDDFNDTYEKLLNRIISSSTNIETKLKDFNSPADVTDFKNNLKSKIEDFYSKNKDSKIVLFSGFISKQSQLLNYKLTDERVSYNSVNDKYYAMENFTGTAQDKYSSYKTLKASYEDLSSKVISPELKSDVSKKKWEVETKLIDSQILSEKLSTYDFKYPKIDDILRSILQKLYDQAAAQGKADAFNQKLDNSLVKIEQFLSDSSLQKKTKYLLLKIKKAMISFRNLK